MDQYKYSVAICYRTNTCASLSPILQGFVLSWGHTALLAPTIYVKELAGQTKVHRCPYVVQTSERWRIEPSELACYRRSRRSSCAQPLGSRLSIRLSHIRSSESKLDCGYHPLVCGSQDADPSNSSRAPQESLGQAWEY